MSEPESTTPPGPPPTVNYEAYVSSSPRALNIGTFLSGWIAGTFAIGLPLTSHSPLLHGLAANYALPLALFDVFLFPIALAAIRIFTRKRPPAPVATFVLALLTSGLVFPIAIHAAILLLLYSYRGC